MILLLSRDSHVAGSRRGVGLNTQRLADDKLHVKLVTTILDHKRLGLLAADKHRSKVHVTHRRYAVSVSHKHRPHT